MWKYIIFSAFVVLAVVVFIRLSSLTYRKRPIIKLPSRILISLSFPFVGLVTILISSFIIALVVSLVAFFFLLFIVLFLFSRPKVIYFRKKKF